MSEPFFEIKDLRVNFLVGRSKLTAVHDISFSMNEGETLCVVGESGCGKSVTANTILRLLPKHTSEVAGGQVLLRGKNLLEATEAEIREIRGNKISMIFQEPMTSLNPVYTIGKQMIETLQAHQKISKDEAFERCVKMLSLVEVPEARQRMHAYPHQLSGGLRQRIIIAMALSCEPELLIADEPTTALDVTIQAQVLSLINKLKTELHTAVLLVTHDMGVVADMADQVVVMYAGEIVEHDTVRGIFKNPLHPYTQGLLASIPRMDKRVEQLYTIQGVVPSLKNFPEGCRFSTRCPDCQEKCQKVAPDLVQRDGKRVRCWKYCGEGGAQGV